MAGCSNSSTDKAGTSEKNSQTVNNLPPQSDLKDAGTQKLMAVVTDYYELKDAFVVSKANQADVAANKLVTSTDSLKSYLLNDSSNKQSIKPYLDTIAAQSRKIITTADSTCEKKRAPFEKISNAMFDMLKKVDLKNAGVYREHCPMAFNEKGAYWLSSYADIKNPYLGKKMIDCGEVTDSLK